MLNATNRNRATGVTGAESRGARAGAPRVGVPYRTAAEEAANKRDKYEFYIEAIREAGGEPVEISLSLPKAELGRRMESLDAVVLPGSPVDVDPARYGAARLPQTNPADPRREQTDIALLDHALVEHKPVLAICYGTQLLNVYRGGTLVQDISSAVKTAIQHDKKGWTLPGDPVHAAQLEAGSRLALLAGATEAQVNTSHHQSIAEPGRGLGITARALDGVVEAVELAGAENWVVGVQWHPERMVGDALAQALFRELVTAAKVRVSGVRG